jgi:predicted polyphosphate/ATP-dependent NAD kinase
VQNINFDEAVRSIQGERHRMMAKAVADINRELDMHASAQINVVGAWQDGAEDAFMLNIAAKSDWGKLRAAAAMQGYLADQKSALIFQARPDGDSVMAEFRANGDLATIHQNLLADGLANHTLIPAAGGARVVIVDVGGQSGAAITQGANRYGSQVVLERGRAEFIGTQLPDSAGDRVQRDDARSAYSSVLSQFASSSGDAGVRWSRIRDRWLSAFDAIKRQIAKLLQPIPRRRLSSS